MLNSERMIKFSSLIEKAKEVYLLVLCDLIICKISESQGYELTVEALKKCWNWVQFKSVTADQLYYYLENLNENDIMTYSLLENNANNEAVWICISNTLAYIIRAAYRYAREKYIPQTIECVGAENM